MFAPKYTTTTQRFVNGAGVYPDLAEGEVRHYLSQLMMIRATFDPADLATLSGTTAIHLDIPLQVEAQPFHLQEVWMMAYLHGLSSGETNFKLGTNSPNYNNLVEEWIIDTAAARAAGGRDYNQYGTSLMVSGTQLVGVLLSPELDFAEGVGLTTGTLRATLTADSAAGIDSSAAFSVFLIGKSLPAQPFIG